MYFFCHINKCKQIANSEITILPFFRKKTTYNIRVYAYVCIQVVCVYPTPRAYMHAVSERQRTDTTESAARGCFRAKALFVSRIARHFGNKKASPKRG